MNANDTILIIDDDVLDRQALLRAFKDLKISNPIVVAQNGKDAIAKLETMNISGLGLIFTDVNMPERHSSRIQGTIGATLAKKIEFRQYLGNRLLS